MSTRFSISLLLSMMVSAVLFGIGATIVLSIPSLSEHAPILLPIVILLSFTRRSTFLLGDRAKAASKVLAGGGGETHGNGGAGSPRISCRTGSALRHATLQTSVKEWFRPLSRRKNQMHATTFCSSLVGFTIAACLVMSAPALAEMVSFKADMKGSSEVPPTDSKGTGSVTATYDTASKTLAWKGSYSGLTDKPTMAHFHGPAEGGKNADVAVSITNIATPFEGTAALTDAQAADLMAGHWYVNVHTAAHRAARSADRS